MPQFWGSVPGGGHPEPLVSTPLPPSFRPFGAGLSLGSSPMVPPPPASPLSRRVTLGGGGGAGAGGRSPGQRVAVNRLRVSETPLLRASACPAPLAQARGLSRLLDRGRCLSSCRAEGGGVGGGRSRTRGLGLPGGVAPGPWSAPTPPCLLPGPLRPGLRGAGPLPPGVAVTSASACVGAGAAAAAGSSGGSANG